MTAAAPLPPTATSPTVDDDVTQRHRANQVTQPRR
jgi:hypothetical protein